jgi:hypothetical protein
MEERNQTTATEVTQQVRSRRMGTTIEVKRDNAGH